jgi:hypothetical protein
MKRWFHIWSHLFYIIVTSAPKQLIINIMNIYACVKTQQAYTLIMLFFRRLNAEAIQSQIRKDGRRRHCPQPIH